MLISGEKMSLLPIIYTSLAIFGSAFAIVLILSYLSYKIKGEPKLRSATAPPSYKRTKVPEKHNDNQYNQRRIHSNNSTKKINFHKSEKSSSRPIPKGHFEVFTNDFKSYKKKTVFPMSHNSQLSPTQNSISENNIYQFYHD